MHAPARRVQRKQKSHEGVHNQSDAVIVRTVSTDKISKDQAEGEESGTWWRTWSGKRDESG